MAFKFFSPGVRTIDSYYRTNGLNIAESVVQENNQQSIRISTDPRYSTGFINIGGSDLIVSSVLENGENKGLVTIQNGFLVGGTLLPGGGIRPVSLFQNGTTIQARQTGFQTSEGISFQQVGTNNILYLSSVTNPQPGQTFTLTNDNSSGSFPDRFNFNPCFASGTQIATAEGEVPVEKLSVGDIAITAGGVHRPVRWIGRRTVSCNHHPRPEAVWPVRVLAGAFGDGLPHRDLWLSPDHAVCVRVLDEVLIPIKHLLNDATIAQVETAEVTYWHVELDSHDILLAEGLPAESFLDTGVRAGFENGAEHMVLHPDFSPLTLDAFCRPLVQDGPIVDAVRLRLLARASELGWTLTGEDNLHAIVNGAVVYPEREGAVARFAIPADATEIRLHSRSFVPERVHVGAGDGRRLGVPVRSLSVVDSAGVTRSLPIGSEALSDGFSFVQGGADRPWRWTTGEAVVPSILWSGTEGAFSLVVGLAPEEGALQAWQAPAKVPSQEASEASPEAAAA